jgi:subtilisin family serine protease
MSSVNSDTNGGTYDYRNASKFITKYNGTSMASPQVAGLLACALELYPTMNQTAAVTYIESTSKLNQMTNTNGGPADFNSLQGSVNRYLYYTREHQDEGQVFPKQNVGIRRVTGQIYPRPRIYSYGRQTPV